MNAQITPLVERAVVERMRTKASFTALDISNALKSDRYPIKHGDVANVVRDIYAGGAMDFYDFDRRLIDVVTDDGAKKAQAFLYLHRQTRDREYTARSQTSLPLVSPEQARDLVECLPAGSVSILPPPSHPACAPRRRSPRQRLRQDGALAVPRALVMRLGWTVGATLALDTEPGTLKLTPTAGGVPVRVWDGLRLRLCKKKLNLGGLAAGSVTLEIDGDGLRIVEKAVTGD